MKQILVDRARHNNALKRSVPATIPALDGPGVVLDEMRILALDESLERLRTVDANQADIVEMRFFAGMTSEEVAEHLGISLRTVNREWSTARAWLRREMRKAGL